MSIAVPGPPDNVKALTVTSSSILVSWMQPKRPNGVIIKYTVYVKHNKVYSRQIVCRLGVIANTKNSYDGF